jgi:hypothetical protein
MPQMDLSCIVSNVVYIINLSYDQNIDLKTLESNCNWKNYFADSRFVPPIGRVPISQYTAPSTIDYTNCLGRISTEKD